MKNILFTWKWHPLYYVVEISNSTVLWTSLCQAVQANSLKTLSLLIFSQKTNLIIHHFFKMQPSVSVSPSSVCRLLPYSTVWCSDMFLGPLCIGLRKSGLDIVILHLLIDLYLANSVSAVKWYVCCTIILWVQIPHKCFKALFCVHLGTFGLPMIWCSRSHSSLS